MKKKANAGILSFKVARVFGLVVCLACGLDKESSLRKEAERGNIHAMYTLGQANLSTTGDGIVKRPNYRDAAHWFEVGAKHGHAPSMYWLTQLGGITNEERVMWLKKGAELGNGACVTELINAYRQGLFGVPEDPIEAFRWVKVGWQMDFKNRQYDAHRQSEEMERLLTTYRSHLKVSLKQKGISDAETRKLLEQIQ